MRSVVGLLLAGAVSVQAWLPHDKNMTSDIHGRSLFDPEEGSELAKRWLPGNVPIRGVNLGSQFIVEPWMASAEWNNPNILNCNNAASEFDCVSALGQSTANTNWAKHWSSWVTQNDITTMQSYGLNTIRIPVGYWILESLKYSSEHFPAGGLGYLTNIVGWASNAGFYIIIDLHGAPFAQQGNQPFTGQNAAPPTDSNPDFYQSSQFQRAVWFVGNMTQMIHSNSNYRNVGAIEIVNEPLQTQNDLTQNMRQNYYSAAYSAIRNVENGMGITSNNYLHVQMMDSSWGSGSPTQYLPGGNTFTLFDNHRYLAYDGSVQQTQQGYLTAACNTNVADASPLIVGEWSLAIAQSNQFNSAFWPISSNLGFYQKLFAAQTRVFERQEGWIFWSWKTSGLGDPRWDYQAAVQAGIIPTNLNNIANPC